MFLRGTVNWLGEHSLSQEWVLPLLLIACGHLRMSFANAVGTKAIPVLKFVVDNLAVKGRFFTT